MAGVCSQAVVALIVAAAMTGPQTPALAVAERGAGGSGVLALSRVSVSSAGHAANSDSAAWFGAMSASGRYVTFASGAWNLVPGDTNGQLDVFLRDRTAGTTARVSVSSAGAQGNGHASAASISGE